MAKINILQPYVFNMIAAGEVVERPASVVKELVENSIDAGATIVDVFVVEGGIKKISVSDNGAGILADDMRSAFLPHATSKLKNITDLDTLSTLGFRGEALASIASVSEVKAVSRARGEEIASSISIVGGNIISETQDSRAEGTSITVENLFFNTPARIKFLKKAVYEQKEVESVIHNLCFANPSVAISLSNEDGVILAQEGGNLADSICSVWGVSTLDKMTEVKQSFPSGITVSGYSSIADFTRPTRSWQTAIVNGRAVECKTVQLAVEKVYSKVLMKRTYPVFVLNISVPFLDVDVNVHPRKSEVRFKDQNAVFSAVYRAVEKALFDSMQSDYFSFDASKNDETEPKKGNNTNADSERLEQQRFDTTKLFQFDRTGRATTTNIGFEEFPSKFQSAAKSDILPDSKNNVENAVQSDFICDTNNENNFDNYSQRSRYFGKSNGFALGQTSYEICKKNNDIPCSDLDNKDFANSYNDDIRLFDGKIIGQIFDTYIVVERDDLVYVIDQHAAHERVLYDKISQKITAEFSQPLLIPYKYALSASESEYLASILPTLKDMGFDIEKTADYAVFYAVPVPLEKIDFKVFLGEIFNNRLGDVKLALKDVLKDTLCQQACKAAIKGGNSLTRGQIENVLQGVVSADGKLPSKCPHGRPCVVALKRTDIEKLFKRIV